MRVAVAALIVFAVIADFGPSPVFTSGELPTGWKACKRSDPKRDACLTDAAQIVISLIAKNGAPKYGIFPADPLQFKQLLIDQSDGPVNIKLKFTDLNVYGMKEAKVRNASWNTTTLTLDLLVPSLLVSGDYDISGRVLILPIVGQGLCNITIDKAHIDAQLIMHESTKGKNKAFNVEKILLKIMGSKVTFHFGNLFNGDKRLGDNMNKFLNENWELIWDEVQTAISQSIGMAIQQISNRLFSKVSSTDIAPIK